MVAEQTRKVRFRMWVQSEAEWTEENPILLRNEPGFVFDKKNVKFGDGVTPFNDLEYFFGAEVTDPGDALVALQEHIASSTPHPVLGDPDFDLVTFYRNVKAG